MGTPYNSGRFSGPGNYITTSAGVTAAEVLPANASRKYLRIQPNFSGLDAFSLYITFDGSTPSASNGLLLEWGIAAGAYSGPSYGNLTFIEFGTSFVPTGSVKMICTNGTVPIHIIWA
jgi:hypothetical protein